MAGAGDPDNRRMMRFGRSVTRPERGVLDRVERLAGLRRTHPSLREGDLTTLHADADTYAYLRSTFDEQTLVAINRAAEKRTLELTLPAWCPAPGSLQTLLGGARARSKGSAVVIEMPARSSAVFHLR
jgi:glycosidase